jgi:glycosyltransferase involved in cell wall biosynthesis
MKKRATRRPDKPHVIYILTKLELGGAQKICLALMTGLNEQTECCSLISGSEGVLIHEAKKFNSVFLLESFKREVSITSLWHELKTVLSIIKIIKKIKVEQSNVIVHTHSTKAGILGRWAAWAAGVKHRIHTVHGFGFHEHQSKPVWLAHYFFELITSYITTQYICVSEKDRITGTRLFPKFNKKNTIIRAAVDFERFYIPAKSVKERTKQKIIIGTVSCFKPQKNLFDLLSAFKQVHERLADQKKALVHLEIIGDGAQREQIEKFISDNNLADNITLLGWQGNVETFMRTWDIFAMSSLWEGLPCAIIEARLNKLPVIAYNVGGISEVIFDKKNGFLVTPNDWQVLAERIALTAQDSNLRTSLGHHPDNLIDFSNRVMVKKHEKLYQKLSQASR